MRTSSSRIVIACGVLLAIAVSVFCIFLLNYQGNTFYYFAPSTNGRLFEIQSIDTMKYSRDVAAQTLDNLQGSKSMIDSEMKLVAEIGATHVAIGTPYDARFIPVLTAWVASARAHNLSIWFRGNFSGWEKWFGYGKMDRTEHKELLREFLRNNPELFVSGDIFTPCPECENGGPGDPRQTGDVSGYNAFLREEKNIADNEFKRQGKDIAVYPSMNADIARQIITPATVEAFNKTILIDHYVRTPEQFARDIKAIPEQLQAAVGLGEFGAPIPDLNGWMTQAQQANYIDALFKALYTRHTDIPVVNYWTLRGGSTALATDNGTPRAAYFTVQNYFKAFNVYGILYNSLGESIRNAEITIDNTDYGTVSVGDGTYQIFVPRQYETITIRADGYVPVTLAMPSDTTTTIVNQNVHLEPIEPDWWYTMRKALYKKLQLRVP